MSKSKPNIDTNFTNKKVDFGIERSQDANSANANLNIVVEEYLRPKGVLTDNKQHDAIILSDNTIDKSPKSNFYHVYVPMVHQTIDMPMVLLSKKSPLKGKEANDAYRIEVLTNFNDSTSYMEADISETLTQGQMVRIVYSNVVGGIPSKGRIVKKLKGTIDAEQAFILFATGEGEEATGGSSSTGAANRKSTSRTTPSPVKISQSAMARRNEKLKKSKKSPCREIYKNRAALSRHNNYDGDMRVFTSNCPDFKLLKSNMQQLINSTSAPGKAINLLNKNGLGEQFKKIMLNDFVGGPYMHQGKAEFTSENAYKMSSFRGTVGKWQGETNKKYLSGGGGNKKGLGGKSYAEYWQSQGKLVKTAQGMRMAGAFDSAALPPYLCLKSGFLLNVSEKSLPKTNSNYPTTTRASQGFLVNIEQWAATPGLQGRYLSPDGHIWTSAGDGAKLMTSGKYKGYYKVNYFNASGHSAKNQYRRGNTAAYLKYNGARSPKNIVRYKGAGKTRPVELVLPWAIAYADYTGDFDKNPSTLAEQTYPKSIGSEVTPEQLMQIFKTPYIRKFLRMRIAHATKMAPYISEALRLAGATTAPRKAMMLAQLGWESGGFWYLKETASGEAYNGRKSLGNTEPGDGPRYKGRGFIQITGRRNYTRASNDLGIDLVNNPSMAEHPSTAAKLAAWYWREWNLNPPSDRSDVRRVTRLINGGYNHLHERQGLFDRAMEVL